MPAQTAPASSSAAELLQQPWRELWCCCQWCVLCAAHPATAPAAPCMHWHHMLSCSRTPSMSACRHSTGGINLLMLASKCVMRTVEPLQLCV